MTHDEVRHDNAEHESTRRQRFRLRLAVLLLVFAACILSLGYRAYELTIVEGDLYRGMAEDEYLREVTLPPRRGYILDRFGDQLAVSVDVESIYAHPRQIREEERPLVARALAKALAFNPAEAKSLEQRLTGNRYFTWVKRRVSPREAAAVKALDFAEILGVPTDTKDPLIVKSVKRLKGIVGFTLEPRRFYPHGQLAAPLMGYVGIDKPLAGIELANDKALAGQESKFMGLRDALGQPVYSEGYVPTVNLEGADVQLTIDAAVQNELEKQLAEAVKNHEAKSAWAAMMDPHTGDIIAMATVPSFDPNDYERAKPNDRRNRVIQDTYEPGSTIKTFLVAGALDRKAVKPDQLFDCENGAWPVGDRIIHDAHPHGVLSVREIHKFSSNIGSIKIGLKMGQTAIVDTFRAFGFGAKTNIALPGEASGVLRNPRNSDVSIATLTFGQGPITATALQLLTAVSAIANGGTLYEPRIVDRIVDRDGKIVEARPPVAIRRVIREETAREMRSIMSMVTEDGGTATRARIPCHKVAGKTGTSQKPDPATGGYSATARVSSFMGFVPAHNPRFAMVVVVDEPKGIKYGGIVAAPVFSTVAELALKRHGVACTEEVVATAKPGANPSLAALAHGIVAANAEETTPTSREGDVAGFMNEGVPRMPDLRGKTLVEVVEIASRNGFRVQARGSGVVVKQAPRAGANEPDDGVVRLVLNTGD